MSELIKISSWGYYKGHRKGCLRGRSLSERQEIFLFLLKCSRVVGNSNQQVRFVQVLLRRKKKERNGFVWLCFNWAVSRAWNILRWSAMTRVRGLEIKRVFRRCLACLCWHIILVTDPLPRNENKIVGNGYSSPYFFCRVNGRQAQYSACLSTFERYKNARKCGFD